MSHSNKFYNILRAWKGLFCKVCLSFCCQAKLSKLTTEPSKVLTYNPSKEPKLNSNMKYNLQTNQVEIPIYELQNMEREKYLG